MDKTPIPLNYAFIGLGSVLRKAVFEITYDIGIQRNIKVLLTHQDIDLEIEKKTKIEFTIN